LLPAYFAFQQKVWNRFCHRGMMPPDFDLCKIYTFRPGPEMVSKAMTGSLRLREYPGEIVRLSCPKCGGDMQSSLRLHSSIVLRLKAGAIILVLPPAATKGTE